MKTYKIPILIKVKTDNKNQARVNINRFITLGWQQLNEPESSLTESLDSWAWAKIKATTDK